MNANKIIKKDIILWYILKNNGKWNKLLRNKFCFLIKEVNRFQEKKFNLIRYLNFLNYIIKWVAVRLEIGFY